MGHACMVYACSISIVAKSSCFRKMVEVDNVYLIYFSFNQLFDSVFNMKIKFTLHTVLKTCLLVDFDGLKGSFMAAYS